jgi:hypothetical protein
MRPVPSQKLQKDIAMTDIVEGEAVTLHTDSATLPKRSRRPKLLPQYIRRSVRETLVAVMIDDQTEAKCRVEAARFLIRMVGANRDRIYRRRP